ncbi:MAG: DUF4097 family beta strand repeat-containing protein [Planctomycetota bacterium]
MVEVSAPLAAGGSFAAKTHNGSITVTGADVAECRVTATIVARAGSEEQAKKLTEQTRIRLEPDGNRLKARIDKPRTGMNQSVSVSLDVTVPRQTDAVLTTHNGKVKISDLRGRIDATTHNGKVRASGVIGTTKLRTHNGSVTCEEISGDIQLRSYNGNVRAVYSQSAPPVCDVSIVTHNGRVEFAGPPHYSARVDVSVRNGTISTELPITLSGKLRRRKLHGTIGAGEGRLHVETRNGAVTIR